MEREKGGRSVIEPYYRDDKAGIVIYHGDCREVLPALELSSVDVVLIDIPYGEVNRESGGLRNLDKGVADVETFPISFAVEQASRLGTSVYAWCGTEQVSELRAGFVGKEMTTRLCIWEKTDPSPMNGERLWLSSIESCVFARKPKAYFDGHCRSPVWRGPVERDRLHPTQKPDWLFRDIVNVSAPPGGFVLDFCMGSGTTLRAAKDSCRRAIGIELEERYCEIAANRLRQEVLF